MQHRLAIVLAAVITAITIATFATAQPGVGFSKTAPLAGTGSSGSPLRIDGSGCSSDQVLKWNGSAWACAADNGGAGDIEAVTAGIGLEGGATSGTASLSLLSSCADGQVLKSASSGTSWVCANDIDTDSGGDITSVGATSGGGLTGGSSSGAALLGLLTTCTTGQGLEWDGDSWECADDDIGSPGGGDIESVGAGNGLTGGGTVGAVTLDVGAGTGISVAADSISVNITGASCSAGQYMSALSATGGGTCTAEVGDISSVVAGNGLTDGGTSGAVTLNVACGDGLSCAADEVRMRQDCSTNQVLKWTGTDWTCQDDVGGGFDTAGNGLTSSGTTVNVVCGSNLACAADSVNLATNVDVGGTLDVTGATTLDSIVYAGPSRVVYMANAGVGALDFYFNANSDAAGYINYRGYNGSTTRFRSLIIADGKGATIAAFTGSTKATDLEGELTVDGNLTCGDADSDNCNARGILGFTGTDPSVASGTATINGEAQTIQITLGAELPAGNSVVINFNRTFSYAPYCVFSAGNANAAGAIDHAYTTTSTTQLTLTSTGATLPNGSVFNVFCPGRF